MMIGFKTRQNRRCDMRRLALVMVVLTGLFVFGCKSYVEIKNPPKGYKYIYTPYDLKVVHTGCGTVKPETFEARLEYDPTGDEDDITSAFTYADDEWTASDYPLLTPGKSKLFAQARVSTGLFCKEYQKSDEREFFVLPRACITGKVLQRWATGEPQPYPNAPITVFMSGSTDIVAEGFADESGNYCLDVPMGSLDLVVKETSGGNECEGKKENVAVTHPGGCGQGGCVEVEDIIAYCYPL
jgi:hypothetical protein